MTRYENLTKYIKYIEETKNFNKNESPFEERDGNLYHIGIIYTDEIDKFIDDLFDFFDKNKEGIYLYSFAFNLNFYEMIEKLNVCKLNNSNFIIALILKIIRDERFCDGNILHFLENGFILKLLKRLNYIDKNIK